MLGLMGRLDNFRALGYGLGFVFVTAVLPPVTGLVTACVTLTRQVDDPIGMMPVPAVITPVGPFPQQTRCRSIHLAHYTQLLLYQLLPAAHCALTGV